MLAGGWGGGRQGGGGGEKQYPVGFNVSSTEGTILRGNCPFCLAIGLIMVS